MNGTNPNAAKPAPDQSLLLTASYTSYAATASPTGVKLAASSRSNNGFNPLTNGPL